jgi:hypothetical protein
MQINMITFKQLFSTLFILFVGLLFATGLQAWTGSPGNPPSCPAGQPGCDALIDVGIAPQVKDAGLSVNALTSYGSDYVQNRVGVGTTTPVVALDVAGALKVGNGGENCTASLAGGLRYNVSTQRIEYCNGSVWGSL